MTLRFEYMTRQELLNIVEKLPRTKDGMPVIPTISRVFHPNILDEYGKPDGLQYNGYNNMWTSPYRGTSKHIEECYSTVKLATEAR